MKIGVVCYPTYGGSGVVATELGKYLADLGYQIHFISSSQPERINTLNENLYFHEVRTASYPLFQESPYVLALASKMVDVVIHEKIDLLHVHYAIPHATAAYLAKQILKTKGINIPVVTTLHGTDITLVGTDKSFEPVVEFSINESDVVTAVSQSLIDETYANFNITKEIHNIPNFIDLNNFSRQPKDHFKTAICPNNERLLIHISNFRKVKNTDQVIKIFHKLNQIIPSKLLMIGDGPERGACEELCRQLGTCNDIRFLGKMGAVEEVLSVSDLFILPSEKESFGLAALEAMACQVPVCSSNVGGLTELNIDGFSGKVCPVGDIDAMVEACVSILKDDATLATYKKNALKRATDFDIKKIVVQYENIYKSLVKG
jgi:L-malate glycosyltransferase